MLDASRVGWYREGNGPVGRGNDLLQDVFPGVDLYY